MRDIVCQHSIEFVAALKYVWGCVAKKHSIEFSLAALYNSGAVGVVFSVFAVPFYYECSHYN